MESYFLKNAKRIAVKAPTMDANCPIQKMNIHLIISAFVSARSVFVATFSSKVALLVSSAVSTASAILVACFSSKTERSVSNTFKVLVYAKDDLLWL